MDRRDRTTKTMQRKLSAHAVFYSYKHFCAYLFKSDSGALSAKDERETLLTTRSSSEKFILSLVLS